jgi:hypothetical protein
MDIRFSENALRGSRTVPCGRTYIETRDKDDDDDKHNSNNNNNKP